jgi:hypothetical protein
MTSVGTKKICYKVVYLFAVLLVTSNCVHHSFTLKATVSFDVYLWSLDSALSIRT